MVLFSEDHIQETNRRGRIEVICGSMFSGKTEELIRRLKRAKFAKQRVEIFKPAIDTRYSEEEVVSHDSHSIASTPIDSSASILLFTSEICTADKIKNINLKRIVNSLPCLSELLPEEPSGGES